MYVFFYFRFRLIIDTINSIDFKIEYIGIMQNISFLLSLLQTVNEIRPDAWVSEFLDTYEVD
jgi:hypothetical protein